MVAHGWSDGPGLQRWAEALLGEPRPGCENTRRPAGGSLGSGGKLRISCGHRRFTTAAAPPRPSTAYLDARSGSPSPSRADCLESPPSGQASPLWTRRRGWLGLGQISSPSQPKSC